MSPIPKEYYVVVSTDLSVRNVNEIYNLFEDYMKDQGNIIHIKEIDSFLKDESNTDILRKNYKLWLDSTNILTNILNNNLFIDCETLLVNIKEEQKFLVETEIMKECRDLLSKEKILFLTGDPGVGKTMSSKMLVLEYANEGYRVIYTTNGDISDVKKTISSNKDIKEIILLDDSLGQHYFNMSHTKESELVSLINYVRMNPNKKLIMNSRVTILNQAMTRSREFKKAYKEDSVQKYRIDMNKISLIDKAKIFYNHIYYNNLPNEYFSEVKKDKRYRNIVRHKNYTPRIVEYVTDNQRIDKIDLEDYYSFIMNKLNEPDEIWKDEFYQRLENIDRILLYTLYSLTDTTISYEILKTCFERRISLENVDTTVDNFEQILRRLNNSMLKIIDNNGKKEIGVLNPSINDFLKPVFWKNNLEREKILKSTVYFEQIERSWYTEEQRTIITEMIEDHSVSKLKTLDINKFISTIVLGILKQEIKDSKYENGIKEYLLSSLDYMKTIYGNLDKGIFLLAFFNHPNLFHFYKMSLFLETEGKLEELFDSTNDLELLIDILHNVNELKCEYDLNIDEEFFKESATYKINSLIEETAHEIDYYEYSEVTYPVIKNEIDINGDFNESVLTNELEMAMNKAFEEEISEKIGNGAHLYNEEEIVDRLSSVTYIDVDMILVQYQQETNFDEDQFRGYESNDYGVNEIIDSIFNRERNFD